MLNNSLAITWNKVIEHLVEVTKLDSIQTPKLVQSYITVVGSRNDIVFNILISCYMDGGFCKCSSVARFSPFAKHLLSSHVLCEDKNHAQNIIIAGYFVYLAHNGVL